MRNLSFSSGEKTIVETKIVFIPLVIPPPEQPPIRIEPPSEIPVLKQQGQNRSVAERWQAAKATILHSCTQEMLAEYDSLDITKKRQLSAAEYAEYEALLKH